MVKVLDHGDGDVLAMAMVYVAGGGVAKGVKSKISGVEVVKENVRMFWEGSGRLGRMNDGNRQSFQMFRDSPLGRDRHYRKTSFRPKLIPRVARKCQMSLR